MKTTFSRLLVHKIPALTALPKLEITRPHSIYRTYVYVYINLHSQESFELFLMEKMSETTFTDKNLDRIRNIHHGNFLDYLSSAYEVLRKIFSYLSLEDLEIVCEAFEKWKPIVETTKKERTVIDTFVFSNKCEDCETWSEANFCITFCMEEAKLLEKKLQKYLTHNSQFIMIESRAGVIGTLSDYSQIVQHKPKKVDPIMGSVLATHLRIPSFPDVGIKTFVWYSNISFEDFRNSFSLPDNKIIKCLLILIAIQASDTEACDQKDDFVLYLQTTQSESFAVGGCLIDSFLNDSNAITKYIVFYGDKVESASIVLKKDVQTEHTIDSTVEELKLMCPRTDKGVLFVFRCCNRNKNSRQSKTRKNLITWEGDALMKYFPSTPIVGCYGYGELGRKFPDNETSQPVSKRAKQSDIWDYNFSTSIVYVGFKK